MEKDKSKKDPLVGETKEDVEGFEEVDNFFKSYRRNLAIRIIAGFALLFFLILELVFHKTIYNSFEKNLIIKIQVMFGTNTSEGNFLMMFFAKLCQPYWIFMIITHFMFTIYYGVNAILGAKIILSSLLIFSAAKILNLLHREPRPFWMEGKDNKKIFGWGCNPTFANPDLSILCVMFFMGYTSHCFRRRGYDTGASYLKKHFFSLFGGAAVSFIIVIKLMAGELFFTQIVVFIIYTGFFQYLIRFFDEPIDKIIERSTFRAHLENKYILNYFLIVLVILVVEIMLFVDDDTESYKHMTYLHNYLKCEREFGNGGKEPVYLNEAVGWYPTFHEGVYLVAMMASVLGISYAFRNVQKESFWFKPTKKEKTYRVVVVNAWACFGWIAGFFRQKNQALLDRIGIRAFYGNCIIVFVLFFVALGLLPRYLFAKLHDEKAAIEQDKANLKLEDSIVGDA